jgi:hypothetical protein
MKITQSPEFHPTVGDGSPENRNDVHRDKEMFKVGQDTDVLGTFGKRRPEVMKHEIHVCRFFVLATIVKVEMLNLVEHRVILLKTRK